MTLKKKNLVISLLLVMFLAAVEGTIVTMATPTIARSLQGLNLISLVFSIYLLTSAVSTPIYGKLADLFGRKNTLSIGIIIFLAGSFFCGLSRSMVMLIAFRAVQGLGAGSIFTISYTIIGDVFPLEERAKLQGGLNTVWGIASLVGPFLGGFLIDALSWNWIFFINIPFGLLSVFMLQRSLSETFEKKKHRIDYAGTTALSLALVSLLSIFLFNEGSDFKRFIFVGVCAVLTILLLLAFYKIERKAKEPIMSFDIFTKKSKIASLSAFLIFAVLIGIDVYMPMYVQNVLGYRPLASGLAMLPMSIAWLIASLILGKLILRFGGKIVTVAANIVLLISSSLLLTLGANSSVLFAILYNFIIGLAFGTATTSLMIIVQDSAEYKNRGSAVAAYTLLRTLGQAIGVSVFGNIFNLNITKYFLRQGIRGVDPSNIYESSVSQNAVTAEQIKYSIYNSVHTVFISLIILCCLSLVLSMTMPRDREEPKTL